MSYLDGVCEIHPIYGEQWRLMVPYFNFMTFILLNYLSRCNWELLLFQIYWYVVTTVYFTVHKVWFVTNNVWKLKSYKLLYCALIFYFFQMFKKIKYSYLLHFSQLF